MADPQPDETTPFAKAANEIEKSQREQVTGVKGCLTLIGLIVQLIIGIVFIQYADQYGEAWGKEQPPAGYICEPDFPSWMRTYGHLCVFMGIIMSLVNLRIMYHVHTNSAQAPSEKEAQQKLAGTVCMLCCVCCLAIPVLCYFFYGLILLIPAHPACGPEMYNAAYNAYFVQLIGLPILHCCFACIGVVAIRGSKV